MTDKAAVCHHEHHDEEVAAIYEARHGTAELSESPPSASVDAEARAWQPTKRKYQELAVGYLAVSHPVRRISIWLLESWVFEPLVLLVIMANCVVLALYEPLVPPDQGRNGVLANRGIELSFLLFFSLEAATKIIAVGFTSPRPPHCSGGAAQRQERQSPISGMRQRRGSCLLLPVHERVPAYLDDGWNVLDFVVLLLSWVGLMPGVSNLSVVQTVRLLRPLRTITVVPGMRLLVGTIIRSLPMLGNVMLMTFFLFTMFGILGVQLFKGKLRNRCFVLDESGAALPFGTGTPEDHSQRVCTLTGSSWPGNRCSSSEQCLPHVNPNHGVTSFDNLLYAWLTIFQCITLEGWTTVMYQCMDATSGWSFLYFVLLVFFCSFFLLQLALGVVTEVYEGMQSDMQNCDVLLIEAATPPPTKLPPQHDGCAATAGHRSSWLAAGSAWILCRGRCVSAAAAAGPCALSRAWASAQSASKALVDMPWFGPVVLLLILLNTVVLAMEFHGMSRQWQRGLESANGLLTLLFVGECLLKLVAYGLQDYLKNTVNALELLIVLASLMELVMSRSGSLSVFRSFRVLRVVTLFSQCKSLHKFLRVITNSITDLVNMMVIVLLTVFIYALLGMQLFGGTFNFQDEEKPRAHFDTLLWSVVTVFQVLTGEDWNTVMYDSVRATSILAVFYFITLIMIGNFLILNLFLAILLGNFSDRADADADDDGSNANDDETKESKGDGKGDSKGSRRPSESTSQDGSGDWKLKAGELEGDASFQPAAVQRGRDRPRAEGGGPALPHVLMRFRGNTRLREVTARITSDSRFEIFILFCITASSVCLALESPQQSRQQERVLLLLDRAFTLVFTLELLLKVVAQGLIILPNAYLRSPWNVLDGVVVLMSIVGIILSSYDLSWVRVFRALRVLRPLGMINKVPELKVVVSAIMSSLPGVGHVILLATLFWMVFAILGMQLFMGQFFHCRNDTCCTASDDYSTCRAVHSKAQCTGWAPSGSACRWENSDMNFDNFPNAMLTLLQMCTTEGWTTVMIQGVDARGFDQQPVRDANELRVFYFLAFMVVGSIFVVNLFVGIILDNFASQRKAPEANHTCRMLTKEQKAWAETMRMALQEKPRRSQKPPGNWLRRGLFHVIQHPGFEVGVMLCIGANTVCLALEHEGQGREWGRALDISNTVFTVLFVVEAAVKMLALGIRPYFRDAWNQFDCFVATVNFVSLFARVDVGASAIRALRTVKVLRLIHQLKGLQMLLSTLVISAPTMMNVAGLGALVFFVFAVLGVGLFGRVKLQQHLNHHTNFQNFGHAMLTLTHMTTGEGWNSIMFDCMVQPPDCEPAKEPYCAADDGRRLEGGLDEAACGAVPDARWVADVNNCGLRAAPLYFIAFVVVGAMIMLNLVIAVILENFFTAKANVSQKVTQADIDEFKRAWSVFDPQAQHFIPSDRLPALLQELQPPLGLGRRQRPRPNVLSFICELQLKLRNGNVFYHSLLHSLISRAMGVAPDASGDAVQETVHLELKEAREKLEVSVMMASQVNSGRSHDGGSAAAAVDGSAGSAGGPSAAEVDAAEALAAAMLQAAVRGFLDRKRLRQQQQRQQHLERYRRAKGIASRLIALLDSAERQREGRRGGPQAEVGRESGSGRTADAAAPFAAAWGSEAALQVRRSSTDCSLAAAGGRVGAQPLSASGVQWEGLASNPLFEELPGGNGRAAESA